MHECKLVHLYTSGFERVSESTPVMRRRAIGLSQVHDGYHPGRLQGQPQELEQVVLAQPHLMDLS